MFCVRSSFIASCIDYSGSQGRSAETHPKFLFLDRVTGEDRDVFHDRFLKLFRST